eukprot:s168_g37.t1
MLASDPENIWFSPTCGPWSSWSNLNGNKSLEGFDMIQRQRQELLYQLALGIVLLRFQFQRGKHLHWEQPRRSAMFVTPLLQELYAKTWEANFDMCHVGELRDPVSQLLYQKSMSVRTTSSHVHQALHGRFCRKNHQHQVLEGSIQVKGQCMKRTEFSERYPRKFARYVAKVLVKTNMDSPKGFFSDVPALTADAKRKNPETGEPPSSASKRIRQVPASTAVKCLQTPARLIPPDGLPTKRRRFDGKTPNPAVSDFQELFSLVKPSMPRVGRKHVTDPAVIQILNRIFDDKQVIRVIACKGTERAIPPPKDLLAEEAPFRRTIIECRGTQEIMVEDQWEDWTHLSQRKLTRPIRASHLNITVFAANPMEASSSEPSMQMPGPHRPDAQSPDETDEKMPEQAPPVMPLAEMPAVIQSAPSMPDPGIIAPIAKSSPETIDVASQKHGSRFLALPPEERGLLARIHKNLGHPSNQVLGQVLRQKGYSPTMIQALEDYQCSTCQMHKRPKIARPATLHSERDFGDKVSVDGISWTNKDGKVFHFYHYLDHGTNYHVAVIAPNRTAEHAIDKLNAAWINWAGPPNEFMADAATEFDSETFSQYLQTLGIKSTITPPQAHWQMGRSERHGQVLQEMLRRFETEHAIQTYAELQLALTQCTQAKNSCSLRHGYSPETLVFGKGFRNPGSNTSDDQLSAHLTATDESAHGIRFRAQLAFRETARRAFHAADNSMAIRRAALRRSRPPRGQYEPGEWVMIWRANANVRGWIGPAKVIQQDQTTSVYCQYMGSLIRAAPEHVRPVTAVEATIIPEQMQVETSTTSQDNRTISTPVNIPSATSPPSQPLAQTEHHRPPSLGSQEQPDQEPAIFQDSTGNNQSVTASETPVEQSTFPSSPSATVNPEQDVTNTELPAHEVPVPDLGDDELLCDLLVCSDVDSREHLQGDLDLAWRFEVDLDDIGECPQNEQEVEAAIFLATASKKQRTEVKLGQLNTVEREEFEKAKASEISNWLSTGTVCRILRNKLSPEQILRCRWIYTWKPIESVEDQVKLGGKTRKAKARLVVLGYLDPALEDIPRDSPTLNRQSRMLILQLIASMNWLLMSFDIKAAFLQGSTQGRTIGIEPPIEMIRAMNLTAAEVCQLSKSAYGLIDAPYLWFQEIDKALRELSFLPSPFDPMVYLLYPEGSTTPAGIIGLHVDDGLCGGNQFFLEQLQKLEKRYPFGAKKSQSFVFTGIEMSQNTDHSIKLSQEKYVSKIEPIHISGERRQESESKITKDEQQGLRALIGSLQYASVNTRPDLASRLSFLQSQVNSATVQTLIQANKVLHDAKRHKDVSITIQPVPIDKIRFLAFSDASFSSKKQPDSHTGMMIMTTHDQIRNNITCPVSPISWGCKKIQKVVVSTLSAEATSLNSTLDQLSWLRLYWGWILNPKLNWKQPKQTLHELPITIANATIKDEIFQNDIAVTDCKSLYDLVSRTAPPNCQEFRTQLLARSIKDLLSENISLRWVHSGAQVADALTKEMECSFLRHILKIGKYQLHDQEQILKDRASARNRLKWLQNQQNTED